MVYLCLFFIDDNKAQYFVYFPELQRSSKTFGFHNFAEPIKFKKNLIVTFRE